MNNKAIVLKIPMLLGLLPLVIIWQLLVFIYNAVSGITVTVAILKGWLSNDYPYLVWLKRDLADCESILELGCGRYSPLLKVGAGPRTVAVDIWEPYVTMHNKAKDYHTCVLGNILTMDLDSYSKSFDAVVICDVLEHLPREEVLRIDLFKAIEKVARKKVILFTPNGFIENDKVDGDPYQEHVSAWEQEDYTSRGYKVVGSTGLRWLMGKASLPKYRPELLGQLLILFSQPLVYWFPDIAWHSYAVKVMSK